MIELRSDTVARPPEQLRAAVEILGKVLASGPVPA